MGGIADVFNQSRTRGKKVFVPYITAGYPDKNLCTEYILRFEEWGGDVIEFGLPFSDPIADGPTIQASTQTALENGMDTCEALEMIGKIRKKSSIPINIMTYFNPVMAFGVEKFIQSASQAGAEGLLIVDMPCEEGQEVNALCEKHDLDICYLVTPTTDLNRTRKIDSFTRGFLYAVSVTGVTGSRNSVPSYLKAFIEEVRANAASPVAVGFGVSTPRQAGTIAAFSDGVVVGSALVKAMREGMDETEALCTSLADAVHSAGGS